jgi:hypothetical protein
MTAYTLTFTGYVKFGEDGSRIFGTNSSLTNDPYTAVFGIESNGAVSSAALTITDHTYNFPIVDYAARVSIAPADVAAYAHDGESYGLSFKLHSYHSIGFPTTLTPFTYSTFPGWDVEEGFFRSDGTYGFFNDNIDTVTLAETPLAVPAPIVGAGLPSLLIACASLIALARRRRLKS